MCREYRLMDSVLVMIEGQAKPLCAELAGAVASYRSSSADYVGGLLALLSRYLRSQVCYDVNGEIYVF